MSNKLPPYALKINRPRHLARIPPENLILTTARLDRAKPSPRSLVQPSPGANEFPSNASPTELISGTSLRRFRAVGIRRRWFLPSRQPELAFWPEGAVSGANGHWGRSLIGVGDYR
ncbi:hypothetical protein ASPNIDRAFT_41375 [Aspergillus niger ATCC 1015]|uniref:Uncharacterized protein n=1 Tax=Aspergillus niger (strain ATCC 1015 / CBS 113.46 / FGSC A1144 / LSHB Ac4 / NCTC 3858a / NRRL 328 / USDA 3528.7) TaxID=380704 RepID=G3Y541_ASPNA|nr:hypothetical protein ASPNIDRAFT_41375 [Aspergillus niger ATCC 1015]